MIHINYLRKSPQLIEFNTKRGFLNIIGARAMHRDTNAIANPIRIAKNVCLFGIQEMLKSEIVLFETLANSIDPTLEDIADPIRIDAT